jgi:hypothetical protein
VDEGRELDAIHEHNRRSWDALIGVPLDEVLAAMTDDEARALLAVLQPIAERKPREVDRN